jgi:group I intron endonuclease
MGTIYILENKINGKCYVGQTIHSFNQRFRQHQNSNYAIGNALRKYGVDNFNKILIEGILEDKMDELEIEYIQKYNSIFPNGYNFETGWHKNKHACEETKKRLSEVNTGKHHSLETRKKQSEIKKGKHISIETEFKKGKENLLFGKHLAEEIKEKISKSNIGKRRSAETIKNLSESHKGQIPWMKGKHHTEEAIKKNSEAHKGQIPYNKGARSIRACPICGKQRKEKLVKSKFCGYLATCGNLICLKELRKKKTA